MLDFPVIIAKEISLFSTYANNQKWYYNVKKKL